MVYVFTALYCEAQIFIEQYHLKKVMESTRFQQFYDENADIRLTITGTGEIAAAAAVSSVCTEYKPGKNDFLLNTGICAGISRQKGIFLVHKLTEQASGKTFYPDMLYRHDFQEAALISGMLPWSRGMEDGEVSWRKKQESCAAELYDMEAAAVYQAGAYFFAPHQMQFLKVISDHGEGKLLSMDQARTCMEVYKESIFKFLEQLQQAVCSRKENPDGLHREETVEQWCGRLSTDMHCSKAMEHVLRQHLRYAVLAGMDYEKIIEEMYRESQLPCKDKREGKRCFETLKQRLF